MTVVNDFEFQLNEYQGEKQQVVKIDEALEAIQIGVDCR